MTRAAFSLSFMMCASFANGAEQGEQSVQLAEGTGRDLTVGRCVICHNVDYIELVSP